MLIIKQACAQQIGARQTILSQVIAQKTTEIIQILIYTINNNMLSYFKTK